MSQMMPSTPHASGICDIQINIASNQILVKKEILKGERTILSWYFQWKLSFCFIARWDQQRAAAGRSNPAAPWVVLVLVSSTSIQGAESTKLLQKDAINFSPGSDSCESTWPQSQVKAHPLQQWPPNRLLSSNREALPQAPFHSRVPHQTNLGGWGFEVESS